MAFHLHENQFGAHKLEWEEIYIALWHTTPKPTSPSISREEEYHSDARFHFPWEAIQQSFPDWIAKKVVERWGVVYTPPQAPLSAVLLLSNPYQARSVYIVLGQCTKERHVTSQRSGRHFVSLYFHRLGSAPSPDDYLEHICEWDHINTWPAGENGTSSLLVIVRQPLSRF